MKILQVNNVYAEKSTGKLTQQIHEGLLREGHESVVVYGRGNAVPGGNVIRLCPDWYGKLNSLLSRITGMPYGGCFLSTARLKKIIRREKPDVVHLQCINGNFVNIYRLVAWLKKQRIKTVVALHAEFMYTANCGHAFDCNQWQEGCRKCPNAKKANKSWVFDRTAESWRRMKKAFSGFEEDCVLAPVSPWTEARARQGRILKDFRFRTVYNGIDTDNVFYRGSELPEEKTVLSVTAHFSGEKDHPKGGWYLLKLAERMPDVTFYVAGKADAVEDIPANLHLLGEIRDQKALADRYRRACVSVIVSSRETFSMPCAESLCCGTPVVGFEAGAPEQIALKEYSEFVPYGDLEKLENVLRRWMAKPELNRELIAEDARKVYSARTMVRSFIELYGRI